MNETRLLLTMQGIAAIRNSILVEQKGLKLKRTCNWQENSEFYWAAYKGARPASSSIPAVHCTGPQPTSYVSSWSLSRRPSCVERCLISGGNSESRSKSTGRFSSAQCLCHDGLVTG